MGSHRSRYSVALFNGRPAKPVLVPAFTNAPHFGRDPYIIHLNIATCFLVVSNFILALNKPRVTQMVATCTIILRSPVLDSLRGKPTLGPARYQALFG